MSKSHGMFAFREDEDEADEVGLCQKVMEGLETIDGLLDEHGIVMVMTTELDKGAYLYDVHIVLLFQFILYAI